MLGFLHATLAEPAAFNVENTKKTIETIRVKHKLPALGVAIVTQEGTQYVLTTGTRRRGNKTPVTDQDLRISDHVPRQ